MRQDRLVMYNDYISHLYTRVLSYDHIGKYVRYVGDFLKNSESISKRGYNPHAFRHFFAKMYLKKTKDVIQLADILGHSSIDTTRIYLQKSYDEQRHDFNHNVNW
jgi:integrase